MAPTPPPRPPGAARARTTTPAPPPAPHHRTPGARRRLHDVRLAHGVLDELVTDGGRQGPRGQAKPAQDGEQDHARDDREDEKRQQPHETQRSGLIDPARRNSLSWLVSTAETVTP